MAPFEWIYWWVVDFPYKMSDAEKNYMLTTKHVIIIVIDYPFDIKLNGCSAFCEILEKNWPPKNACLLKCIVLFGVTCLWIHGLQLVFRYRISTSRKYQYHTTATLFTLSWCFLVYGMNQTPNTELVVVSGQHVNSCPVQKSPTHIESADLIVNF